MGDIPSSQCSVTRQLRNRTAPVDPPTLDGPPPAPPPFSPLRLPGFDLLEEIGRGGMGVVYRARHRALNRIVAIKMILSARLAHPEDRLRFRLEGETAAGLQHPNIVQVHEVGTHDEQPFLVMEFVEGGSLSRRLNGRPQPPADACRMVELLARAVHVAHQRGIVHRDLKPGNVLLTPDGTPKVADFGLAKHLHRSGLTETGRVMGTPGYMAPEQAAGLPRDVGPAADVYALGAILYEMLSGRPPFGSWAGGNALVAVLTADPQPLRRLMPKVPRDLATVCHKALERDPARRYASAEALADDLQAFLEHRPIKARPVGTLEGAAKWARRRPAIAALIAGLIAVTVLGFVGVNAALVYALDRAAVAEHEATRAREESMAAEKQRMLAEQASRAELAQRQRAEAALDVSRLALARREWDRNNLKGSLSLLDQIDASRRGWEWGYLRGLHHGELATFATPGVVAISGIAFHPDGHEFVVAGGNPYDMHPGKTARIEVRAYPSGDLLRTISGLQGMTRTVAYSPDGAYLAACGTENAIRIFDRKTWNPHRILDAGGGHIEAMAWSPDGTGLVTTTPGGQVLYWDIARRAIRFKLTGPLDSKHIAHGPGWFVVGGSPAVVYAANDGTKLKQFPHVGNDGLAVSPDGSRLAVGHGRSVTVYRHAEWRRTYVFAADEGCVRSLAFSPDGQLLASAGADTTVRLWDAEDGRERGVWRGHIGRSGPLAFHPGGAVLASGSSQPGDVRLWDLTRRQDCQVVALPRFAKSVEALDFTADSSGVIILRRGAIAEEADAATGEPRHRLPWRMDGVWRVQGRLGTVAAGGRLLFGLNTGSSLAAFDRDAGRIVREYTHGGWPIWFVSASADGRLVASTSFGRLIDSGVRTDLIVWDPDTGKGRWRCQARDERVYCQAMSADGEWLAQGCGGYTLHKDAAGKEDFRQHGGELRLWRVTSGPQPHARHRLPINPRAVAFSSDGALAYAMGDQIHLLRASDGEKIGHGPLQGAEGVEALAFHPNGRLLAGLSRTELKVWDAHQGDAVLTLRGAPPRPGDNGYNPQVCWSPDGRRLAASNWDESVCVWDGADLSTAEGKAGLRAAADARVVRWHVTEGTTAQKRGDLAAVRFHLARLESHPRIDALLHLDRGSLFCTLGEWEKAHQDYVRGRGVLDHKGMHERRNQAVLCVWAKDEGAYAEAVRDVLAHEEAQPLSKEEVRRSGKDGLAVGAATAALLAVGLGERLPPEAGPLTDSLAAGLPLIEAKAHHWHALALAELRRGRYDEAAKAARKGNTPANWLVLAQAARSRGDASAARGWWTRADGWVSEREKGSVGRSFPSGVSWADWLHIKVLHRQTARLMKE